MSVTRITVHHEGAGDPTKNVDRFSEGGYSAGIGDGTWKRFRSPYDSWGTLGWNHRSVDICYSGNRMVWSITDLDLEMIRAATSDFRARGELVDNPDVVFHHDSLGSNTVCPGFWTYNRKPEIVVACHRNAPPVPPTPSPPPIGADMACYIDEVHPSAKPTEPGGCTVDPANNIILTRRRMSHDGTEAPSVIIDGERIIPSNMGAGWRARGSIPRETADGRCQGVQLWFYIPGQGLKTRDYDFDAP